MDKAMRWTAKPLLGNAEAAQGKGSFGLKVPESDRDRYFVNDGSLVHLHLLNGPSHLLVTIKPSPSFWSSTGELIDTGIRDWIGDVRGHDKWNGLARPKVLAWPLGKNCFAVLGFEAENEG
jgi:hypothetical protein